MYVPVPHGPNFVALLLVLSLAFIVPLVFHRLRRWRVPVVVGEILTGILIGRSGFNLVDPNEPVLLLLAEIGFVFLMFLAGMEIDLSLLGVSRTPRNSNPPQGPAPGRTSRAGTGPHPLFLALGHFALTLVLAGGVAYLLWQRGMTTSFPLMALLLSTNSLGVMLPVLKEQGLLQGRFGQTVLITGMISDFAAMLLITVQVALLAHGLTLEVLLIGLLFVALLVLYRLGNIVLPGLRPVLEELSHATTQIKVRLAFFLLVAFAALAQLLGAEVILGAFLAGLLVSLLSESEDEALQHQLESMGYGFFVPIFFIMVGVNFNLQTLLGNREAWLVLGVLLTAAMFTKMVPALLFRLAFSWRESLAAGALLSARLSLIIAAAEIGYQLGIFRAEVMAAVVPVAMVMVILAPWGFVMLLGRGKGAEVGPRPTLIVGVNPLGLRLAVYFRRHRHPFVLVDEDAQAVAQAQQQGLPAHALGPDDPALGDLCPLADAVITHGAAARIVAWAQALRRLGVERIVALSHNAEVEQALRALHARPITLLDAQAIVLALATRNPDLLHLFTADEAHDLREVRLENPAVHGRTLRELNLPPNLVVLSIHRGDAYIVPRGGTTLQQGDVVTLMGEPEALQAFAALWGRPA